MACALERLKPPVIKSIRSSLNRRLGGVLSTGFTRATSICGKVAVVVLGVPNVPHSSACAASDHAAATPPKRLMNLPCLVGLNRNLAFRLIVPREGGLMPTPKGHSGA
jgi:hypothetical protein